jgi:hypothetical protein
LVAVLFAESLAAPVVDVELGLIVVEVEYPVVPVLDDIAPIRIGGQGVPFALVRCCAPADAATVAARMSVALAARHRARCGRSILMRRIVSSSLLPCWRPRGLVGGWGAPPPASRAAIVSAPRTTIIVEGGAGGRNARAFGGSSARVEDDM